MKKKANKHPKLMSSMMNSVTPILNPEFCICHELLPKSSLADRKFWIQYFPKGKEISNRNLPNTNRTIQVCS